MKTDRTTRITTGLLPTALTLLAALIACPQAAIAAEDCTDCGSIEVSATDAEWLAAPTGRATGNRMQEKAAFPLPAAKAEERPLPDAHIEALQQSRIGDPLATHDDNHLYLLPYATGTSYRVIQAYASDFSHKGAEQFAIDFRMPEGTPVHAARRGVVAKVVEHNSVGCSRNECSRYANYIVILHDDGTTGEYYHLQQFGALVAERTSVEAGDMIGLSGNTGLTTVPHLHFAVYRGDAQSLPIRFLSEGGIVDRPRQGGRYQATRRPQDGGRDALASGSLNSGPGD